MERLKNIRDFNELNTKECIKGVLMFFSVGLFLGFISKILDETSFEVLWILERLDLGNFFSRMGVWIFICSMISIKSKHPISSALNVFSFLSGMLLMYYLLTVFRYGFYPKAYILIWVTITVISPFLAFICYFGIGNHWVSRLIAIGMILVLARSTFSVGFWYFDLTYPLEFLLLGILIRALYQNVNQIISILVTSVFLLFLFSQVPFINGVL